jgi:hypothetical protein
MKIFLPTAKKPEKPVPIAPRCRSLEGQTWGFVDTSKVNADLFIEKLKAKIAQSYQPKDFVVVRKNAPGFPLTSEQIELLEKCGFVVFCFGD